METIYAYDLISGEYVKRMPYHPHGDGQQDTDDNPVWLLTTQEEAEQACNGDVPDVRIEPA